MEKNVVAREITSRFLQGKITGKDAIAALIAVRFIAQILDDATDAKTIKIADELALALKDVI